MTVRKSMGRKLGDWFDERTGHRALVRAALDEPIVGGARWAYVFGSALLVVFAIQALTGALLATAYSPGTASAWASVYFIDHVMPLGWLVRGLHHFGAQAMVVLVVAHLVQVATFGAYRRPREMNFWLGLALLALTLGFALTGYLLPWDQKGYWATRVATNIAGGVPVVGGATQHLLLGGDDYGNLTLTRFYSFHVLALPAALLLFVALHLALFRKHGVTPPPKADVHVVDTFYPRQVWKDLQAALAVFALVFFLAYRHHGAPLDAPADPASDYPARPEWYFLSLFELLKHLHGPLEIVGTVVLPLAAGVYLFALPWLDRKKTTALGPRLFVLAPLYLGIVGAALLTVFALRSDANDAKFQASRAKADSESRKAAALAASGVPAEGPLAMMRNDPEIRGAALFVKACATCHTLGELGDAKTSSASSLDGWGTAPWVLAVLRDPDGEERFGRTSFKGEMPSQTRCASGTVCKPLADEEAAAVSAYLASFSEPAKNSDAAVRGEKIVKARCTSCHLVGGQGDDNGEGIAPELSGWGTEAWLRQQVVNPATAATYRDKALAVERKGHMPSFDATLSREDIDVVAHFTWTRARSLPPK